jgi:hypothetical protein
MKEKNTVRLIYIAVGLLYMSVFVTASCMIHNKSNKKTIETRTIKEEAEGIFNTPDLTLYAYK